MGMQEYFFEDVDEKMLDFWLEPGGLTFEEFKKKRILYPDVMYLEGNEGRFFQTPSGKMEIFSKQMEQLGISPLPYFQELTKANLCPSTSDSYPLIFTNRKETGFMLSGYRGDPSMRKRYPEPLVEIHPQAAARAGVSEGDVVYIETVRGRITQKVKLNSNLDPRVIMPAFGWWFPEKASTHYDWRKSNINILTERFPEELSTGAIQLRGIPCRIYKPEAL
jgi:anaerobic selenocysteine-containing dehydrogenase